MVSRTFPGIALAVVGLTLACGLTPARPASEPVATISRIEGVALVNQGAEYVTVAPDTPLREGDRLMALEGGGAVVKFKDGCVYHLTDKEILTIGSAKSCKAGILVSTRVAPVAAIPGLGAGGGAAGGAAAVGTGVAGGGAALGAGLSVAGDAAAGVAAAGGLATLATAATDPSGSCVKVGETRSVENKLGNRFEKKLGNNVCQIVQQYVTYEQHCNKLGEWVTDKKTFSEGPVSDTYPCNFVCRDIGSTRLRPEQIGGRETINDGNGQCHDRQHYVVHEEICDNYNWRETGQHPQVIDFPPYICQPPLSP